MPPPSRSSRAAGDAAPTSHGDADVAPDRDADTTSHDSGHGPPEQAADSTSYSGASPYGNAHTAPHRDADSTPYRNVGATANKDTGSTSCDDVYTAPHSNADASPDGDIHTTPHRDTDTAPCDDAHGSPDGDVHTAPDGDTHGTPYPNSDTHADHDRHNTSHDHRPVDAYGRANTPSHRDADTRVCHVDAYRSAGHVLSCSTLTRCTLAGNASAHRLALMWLRKLEWIWPGRVARGKVTLVVGDAGLGKSWALVDIVSRLSTGTPLPGETQRPEPRSTVMLALEDDPEDTIRPRVDAVHGDVRHIHLWTGVKRSGREDLPRLDRDLGVADAGPGQERAGREVGA